MLFALHSSEAASTLLMLDQLRREQARLCSRIERITARLHSPSLAAADHRARALAAGGSVADGPPLVLRPPPSDPPPSRAA